MQKFLRTLMLVALMAVPFASQAQVTVFPYNCDFEDATEAAAWTFVNGTLTNQWVLGTAANNTTSGSYGIYISNDAGASAAYTVSSAAVAYAYRELYLEPGEYTITFDWKCNGESNYDYLLAALVDASVTLTAGTSLPTGVSYTAMTAAGWTNLGPTSPNLKMNLSSTWNTQTATFTVTTAGTYRIVFLWRNDTSSGTAPGACVDNVVVTQNSCPTPSGLLANNITSSSMDLTWTEVGAATSWLVYVNGEQAATANTTSYTLSNLTANTVYNIAVRSLCSSTDTSNAASVTVRTACAATTPLPFAENFSGYTGLPSYPYSGPAVTPACWDYYSNGTNTAATTSSAYYGTVATYTSTSSYACLVANDPYLAMPIQLTGSGVTNSTYIGYGTARGSVKYAVLPAFDAALSTLQISFDYKMNATYTAAGAASTLDLGYITNDDTNTFVSIWNHNSTTTLQHVTELNLSTLAAAAPAGARLAFKFSGVHNGTGTGSGTGSTYGYTTVWAGLDNILVETLPSCARVTNLTATDITNNSVTLNWEDLMNTGATYTVSDATGVIASGITGMTYTVTSLTGNTDYTFSVVANCSANDASAATTVSAHTDCDAMTTLPYLQTFEAATAGSSTSEAFAECWTRLNNGTQYFGYPYISSTSSYNHTDGGTKGLYWSNSVTAGTYGDYQCIVLPEIGGNYSVNGCRVKFWAKASTATYHPVFYVGVMTNAHDINSFVAVDSVNVEGTAWTEYTANLNGYNGNGTFVAIRANRPTSTWYAYVDDILLEELPSCVEVSDLAVSGTTANSVTLTWTDAINTGATYTVSKNDTLVASGISGTTYTVTGLDANTQYTFSVVTNCSADDASPAITVTGRTACATETILPYVVDFEDAISSQMPDCWERPGGTGLYAYSAASNAHGGSMYLRFYSGSNRYAVMPEIAIPDGGLQVKFWTRPESATNSSCADFQVGYITNAFDITTFVAVETYHYNDWSTATYEEKTVNMTNLPAGARIAFYHTGTTGWYWYVDDITIDNVPSCVPVTSLAVTEITSTTVTLTWSGDADSYTASIMDVTGAPVANPQTVTDATVTFTGLTLDNDYTVSVVANCGNNTSTAATTTVHIGYCSPNPTSVDNSGITGVAFGNLDNASTHPTAAPYYGNYSNLVGSVPAGTTATVNITYATGYTYGTIIWVDWNNNLAFEGNEVVAVGTSTNTNPTTLTLTFDIPATQATGLYRMRIAGADSYYDNYTSSIDAAANANPCGSYSYGMAEDYTLYVTEAPSCMPVSNVTIAEVTNNSITVNFTTSNAPSYDVYALTSASAVADSVTVTTGTAVLTGLFAGTTYYVRVQAHCDENTWSILSDPIEVTTALCAPADQCNINITLTDAYGDGGGQIQVVDNLTSAVLGTFTNDEDSTSYTLNVCNGSVLNFVFASTDNWPYENGWRITDANGNVISSHEGCEDETDCTAPTAGTFATYTVSCNSDTTGSDTTVVTEVLTLNMSINDSTMGSIVPAPGIYTYEEGDTFTFTATPNDGYQFEGWYVDYSDFGMGLIPIDTARTYSHTVTADEMGYELDVIATFALSSGDTSVVVEGLTLELAVNDTTMGTTVPAPGTHVFAVGDTLSFDVIAYEGYHFDSAIYSVSMMGQTMMEDTVTDLSEMAMFNNTVVESYMTSISASVMVFFSADTTADTTIVDPCLVTLPFTETFEATSNTTSCWTTDGPGTWSIATGDYSTSTGAYEGTLNAKIQHGTTGDVTKYVSPVFAASADATAIQLSFAHVQRSWSGDIDELRVYHRASANDAWTMVAEYTDAIATWTVEELIIPATATQVAFEYTDNWGYGVGVDNVSLTEITASFCYAVSGVTATLTPGNGTEATLSWTANGDETAWQIMLNGDSTNIIDVTTNPYTLTGLTAEQTYTAQVRAYCSADNQSAWSAAVSFMPTNAYEIVVNDGTATNGYVPIYGYYVDDITKSQFIIPAADLATIQYGIINKLTFYSSNASVNWGAAQFNVYLTETTETGVSALADYTTMTQVYAGSLAISGNQMEVTFTTPYLYMGGNLMVGFLQTVEGSYVSCNWYGVTASGASMGGYGTSISQRNFLPKTKISYIPGTQPTCMAVTNLTASNATANTVTLSWTDTENNGATYSVYTVDATGNTLVASGISGTTYTVTGLTASTAYTFGVEANCSANDASMIATVNANTDCANGSCNITIYAEDSWGDGWNGNTINVMQNGTTVTSYSMAGQGVSNTTIYDTAVISVCAGAPISFSWGAGQYPEEVSFQILNANNELTFSGSGSEMTGGEVFLTMDSCNAASTYVPDSMLVFVAVNDATMGTTNPAPGVNYFYEGDTCSVIAVPNTGYLIESWTVVVLQSGDTVINQTVPTNAPDVFSLFTTPIVVGHGDGVMQFYVTANFAAEPTCLDVTDLTVTDVTETSVSISWTGTAASYDVYNGSTFVANTTDTTYTFTGLTAATTYTFGVQAICSATDSANMVTINVTTACNAAALDLPFTENFEATSSTRACWTTIDADGDGHGWSTIFSGADQGMMISESYDNINGTALTPNNWLVSPKLHTVAGNNVTLEWTAAAMDQTYYAEHYGVYVSTTNTDTASFTMLNEWTLTSAAQTAMNLDLSAYAGQDIYVAFRHFSCSDMFLLTIDNVNVYAGAYVPDTLTVTVATADATMGTTVPAPGTYQYITGDTVRLQAVANNGYIFSGWALAAGTEVDTLGSEYVSLSFLATNMMDYGSISFTALFEAEPTCDPITVYPFVETFNDASTLNCWNLIDADGDGDNWSILAGYTAIQSASWNQTAGALTPDNWLITPQFAIPATGNYEVTWSATAQDQSWPAEHYGLFVSTTGYSDTANYTMLQEWTLSTGTANPVVDLSAYAGQNIYLALRHFNCTDMFRISIDDFTVRAQAGANEVVINVNQNNPAYGTVSGSGTYTIGDSVTVSATPASSYTFSRWIDENNNTVSTENPYTFVAATDLTLTAIFLEAGATTYTITVQVNDSTMGTATGGGSYASGDMATLTATAFAGYEFVNWTQISGFGENVVSTEATFTTTVTGDKTFQANFQQATLIADSLTLNITVNDPTMGTTTPAPGVHRFGLGDTVVLSAMPNTGYTLDSVHVAVSLMGIVLEDTTIVIPMLNQTIVIDSDYLGFTIDAMVYFSADSTPVETYYTVTLSSEDETMGTVSPAGATQVLAGTNFTATATAVEGYHFVAWKSGNAIMSVDSVYTFEVNQDMNLVAHFAENGTPEPNIYTVTVNYDSTMGIVHGAGQYEEGDVVTLTAQPKAGYRFVEWSTGETNTTITFTVTEDVTLNATFAPIDGIEDADMDNVTIYSTDSKIIVRGAEGYNVYVFDINGRMMDSQMNAAETIEFRMANTGIYLVKVGNASAKRVLVVR